MPRTKPASQPIPENGPGTVRRPEAAQGPFRLGTPSPEMPPAALETSNLAFSIAANVTGAYRSCPRRACRQACSAGRSRRCEAEFAPVAYDMMIAMHVFLYLIPYDTAVARHAVWDAEEEALARAAGRAVAAAGLHGSRDGEAEGGEAEDGEERPGF